MNRKRLSEMERHEIYQEIQKYKEKMRKAEMNGIMNEYDVYANKIVIAESYLVDASHIKLGMRYTLKDEADATFTVERLKGVFAWGYRNDSSNEEGIPLSLLQL
ncbi:YfhH family protein [Staphylococcus agnetis]|uniref:YfhH family protein n=1 Tax=Staphylococcus agnetis TaxID=985762 RepID=UPI00071EF593|nr:YfhH family protein [Staphylococcus agnetis]ALN76849.1 YfhH family protein [Staphylococcus agnetis]